MINSSSTALSMICVKSCMILLMDAFALPLYLMYRFGFDDGQEHGEAETARRYHLKRSWARRLEEDSLDILKNHLIACGEYCGNTKKELTEAV